MKLSLLVQSISRAGAGVFEASRQLAQLLAREQVEVDVLGLEDSATALDLDLWHPLRPKVFRAEGPRSFGFTRELRKALDASSSDLAHVHGIWTYPSLAACRWSKQHRRPFIITVHGMLSPWALSVRRWKKRLGSFFFQQSVLNQAACLHAFTQRELENFRQYGLRNPVCVLPNGINLPADEPSGPAPWNHCVESGQKVLLYMGRFHRIKGLSNLLHGWALARAQAPLQSKPWNLVMAGWGEEESALKAQVETMALGQSVHFIGSQFGESKAAAYRAANAFVLPSFSEGLPMAVLEAWSHRLPVLMTEECNLPQGFAGDAAIRIQPEAMSIAAGLKTLFEMSDAQHSAMGDRGHHLVAQRFAWETLAPQMRAAYEWVVGGGPKPACVEIAAP